MLEDGELPLEYVVILRGDDDGKVVRRQDRHVNRIAVTANLCRCHRLVGTVADNQYIVVTGESVSNDNDFHFIGVIKYLRSICRKKILRVVILMADVLHIESYLSVGIWDDAAKVNNTKTIE